MNEYELYAPQSLEITKADRFDKDSNRKIKPACFETYTHLTFGTPYIFLIRCQT